MALGKYPIVSLAHALHFEGRRTLATGIDPMVERKAKFETKQSEAEGRQHEIESSFENAARKWYERWFASKSSRHAEKVMRCLEVDIFPAYGHKFIDEVTPPDIWQVMMAAERREVRGIAKRIHETTNQIFRFG